MLLVAETSLVHVESVKKVEGKVDSREEFDALRHREQAQHLEPERESNTVGRLSFKINADNYMSAIQNARYS